MPRFLAAGPMNVRRPDIAAAHGANVFAGGPAHEPIPERKSADKIRKYDRDRREIRRSLGHVLAVTSWMSRGGHRRFERIDAQLPVDAGVRAGIAPEQCEMSNPTFAKLCGLHLLQLSGATAAAEPDF